MPPMVTIRFFFVSCLCGFFCGIDTLGSMVFALICINVLHMRMDLIRFKSMFNSSDRIIMTM